MRQNLPDASAGAARPAGLHISSRSDHCALRITELAQRARTTTRALRYYEEVGLLAPLRSGGNVRFYPAQLARRACMIVELRRLGVTVPAIADFMDEIDAGKFGALEAVIRRRLVEIDHQREALSAMLDQIAGHDDVPNSAAPPSNDRAAVSA